MRGKYEEKWRFGISNISSGRQVTMRGKNFTPRRNFSSLTKWKERNSKPTVIQHVLQQDTMRIMRKTSSKQLWSTAYREIHPATGYNENNGKDIEQASMKYSLQWETMPGWPYYSNDDEQFQQQWGWWENHLTNGYAVQPIAGYKCHNDPATEYNEDDEEDIEQTIMMYSLQQNDDDPSIMMMVIMMRSATSRE